MIKDQRDFWAGLMFMAFGGFFCLYSVYNYNIGTAFRMGPGYFPMLLGGFLFFLGFLITAKSVLFKSSEEDGGKFGKFDWYNFFVILGSVTIFAVLLRPGRSHPCDCRDGFLIFFRQPSFPLDSDLFALRLFKRCRLADLCPRPGSNRAHLAGFSHELRG